ncbi:MAG TPA: aromatic hydrocarbon degradation protein [Candidatus Tenderia electrophaga]|uniref:Aromatic hydrocarbon degradation protein n=1 Tax=Candidatus Tenderia electrophaga TaxID=1748243 RepID=A0A832J7C7_9GAMM|nr:aromatic hydrocarbon degradation protein [Candidatus Tenderia electrophaga]
MPVLSRQLLFSIAISFPVIASATNGMNMEGYGPISLGMGGTSMAFDNGVAAVMNNPATLSLMPEKKRLDVALGMLGPDVESSAGGVSAGSDGDAYYMPAVGWAKHYGEWTVGMGMFAQGGMGTDFSGNSFMGNPAQSAISPVLENRSELSVGRIVLPLTYNAGNNWHFGATIDFVWAGLDLKMAMSENQFADMANPASQQAGRTSGSLVDSFGAMYEPFGGTGVRSLDYAYFDYSNSSDYSGKARGNGFGGKLGFVYEVEKGFNIGASYHAKTWLNDLETDDANMQMAVNIDTGVAGGGAPSGSYVDSLIPLSGKMTVKDFQWPAVLALGVSKQVSERWQVAADIKRIQWADVMKNFTMVFNADNVASNGGFAGKEMTATLFQNWEDQDVIALGTAYQVTDELVLRFGANLSDNPVPDQYLSALFPAVTEDHYTAGFGYDFSQSDMVNFAISRAPEVSFTSASGITSTHSQTSWQLMFSRLW